MRRAMVEAAAGTKVRARFGARLGRVALPGASAPVSQGKPGIEVSEEGQLWLPEENAGEGRAFRELFPSESALLRGTQLPGGDVRRRKSSSFFPDPLGWQGPRALEARARGAGVRGDGGRGDVPRRIPGPAESRALQPFTERGRGPDHGEGARPLACELREVFPAGRGPRGLALLEPPTVPAGSETVAYHLSTSAFGPGWSLLPERRGVAEPLRETLVYRLETNASGLAMEERTLAPPPAPSARGERVPGDGAPGGELLLPVGTPGGVGPLAVGRRDLSGKQQHDIQDGGSVVFRDGGSSSRRPSGSNRAFRGSSTTT